MGRKRKDPADWLPPYVFRGKSAFEYRPRGGKTVRLASLTAPRDEVLQKYLNAKAAHDEKKQRAGYLVSNMLADYIEGQKRGDGRREPLAPRTIKDYEESTVFINRVMGDWLPEEVRPETWREYMDSRKVLKGPRKGEIAHKRANLELIAFRNAWNYAYERGKVTNENPATGIKLYEYIARDRYVEDAEFEKVYAVAPKPVKVAMSIAWLCGARQGDVLKLVHGRPGQEEPEKGQQAVTLVSGVYIAQGKTHREQIKEWTPALCDAIEMSKGMHVTPKGAVVVSRYVVHTKHGTRYSLKGYQAIWRRAVQKAGLSESFTFHDLKAKGVSDVEGTLEQKREFADHASTKMTRKYDRKVSRVSALNPKKRGRNEVD